jgi:hypothetical protein
MTTCKNCGNVFEGKYCNQCGQSASTRRIDHEFLWDDIQHGILHYDKGIGYSLKKLFQEPGKVIKGYIAGQRVNHFRPISMVIILATVYALIYHLLDLNDRSALDESSGLILEKVFEHYYWFVVATIPIYALTTYIFFKKTGYNLYEFIIFEAFKTSQRLGVHILFLPVLYFLKDQSGFSVITNILLLIDLILILWTNKQFFDKMGIKEILSRSILSYLLSTVIDFIFITIIALSLGISFE